MATNSSKKAGPEGGNNLRVRLLCPDETVFDDYAESVIIKTCDGYEGFLKDRAACCRILASEGEVRIKKAGEEFKTFQTKGGFAHMDGMLTIYADAEEHEPSELASAGESTQAAQPA